MRGGGQWICAKEKSFRVSPARACSEGVMPDLAVSSLSPGIMLALWVEMFELERSGRT